ncbi:hypothetical protein Uis1B_2255 [Bifidobacterium margollesii]|uniref:Antirestriction protein n=1 Tax=Bifidobacterium margollesii TaxID=2020964 RepID=A0A2N5J6S1_9BIFI|nr:antirestriction protein ArdA [Bifidobacterium margollesii]PLS29912.1 hypothetical protein Uis1B_2255 [Bifidobacterium margollesii]
MADTSIEVYVESLARYTQGQASGGWIRLPVSEPELDRFLADTVGVDPNRGETTITDRQQSGLLAELDWTPDRYADLHDLNLLAHTVDQRLADDPDLLDRIEPMARINLIDDPIELANLAAQSDDIEWDPYELPEHVTEANTPSLDERYGWHVIATEMPQLLGLGAGGVGGIDGYIDVERLGRDRAMNDGVELGDHGFMPDQEVPPLTAFDREELRDTFMPDDGRDPDRSTPDAPGDPAAGYPDPWDERATSLLDEWGEHSHDNVMLHDGPEGIADRILAFNGIDHDDGAMRRVLADMVRPAFDRLDGDMPSGAAEFHRLVEQGRADDLNPDLAPAPDTPDGPRPAEPASQPGDGRRPAPLLRADGGLVPAEPARSTLDQADQIASFVLGTKPQSPYRLEQYDRLVDSLADDWVKGSHLTIDAMERESLDRTTALLENSTGITDPDVIRLAVDRIVETDMRERFTARVAERGLAAPSAEATLRAAQWRDELEANGYDRHGRETTPHPAPRPFDLENHLLDGETIADITIQGTATNTGAPEYQIIVPADADPDRIDLAQALEETLDRIIDAKTGDADLDDAIQETMGAVADTDLDAPDEAIGIDQGYSLPAPVATISVRPARDPRTANRGRAETTRTRENGTHAGTAERALTRLARGAGLAAEQKRDRIIDAKTRLARLIEKGAKDRLDARTDRTEPNRDKPTRNAR